MPDPDLARLLTESRKRSGISQAAIAYRAGCDRSAISLAEHGKRHATPELFSVYLDITRKDPDMHRRLLFTAATAGLASTLIPHSAIAQQLDEALSIDIDSWTTRVASLGQDHMQYGTDIMYDKVITALGQISATRDNGKLATHTAKLLVLLGRAQGATPDANDSYQRAQAYATASGDADTIAWVNGRIALGLCDNPATSHKADTYTNIALAQRTSGHIGALGLYLAHYARARAAAVQAQADQALAHLEQARYAYDGIDTDIDGTEWSYAPARFYTDNSYILEAIGRANEAAHWADEARQAGVSGRFTTHLALHALVGRNRAGDPTAADEARVLMQRTDPDQHSTTLRLVAAQAGAREYVG